MGGDPYCCELLLHEHATVSCKDENGWQEIHQVGKMSVGLEVKLHEKMCHVCFWLNSFSKAVALLRVALKDVKLFQTQLL